MPSPKLMVYQSRAALIPSTKPRGFIIGQYADPPKPIARNQIEAGIAHLSWENRLGPLESWGWEIGRAISFAAAIIAIWWSWQQMFGG